MNTYKTGCLKNIVRHLSVTKRFFGIMLLVLVITSSTATRADDSRKGFAIRGGVLLPTNKDVMNDAPSGTGGGLSFFINHRSKSRTLFSLDFDSTELRFNNGDILSSWGTVLTFRHYISSTNAGRGFYVGAGVGSYLSTFNLLYDGVSKSGGKLVFGLMRWHDFSEIGYHHTGDVGSSGLQVGYGIRF